jgi:hypothetical protein
MIASTFFIIELLFREALDVRCYRSSSSIGKPYVKEEILVKMSANQTNPRFEAEQSAPQATHVPERNIGIDLSCEGVVPGQI